MFAGQIDTGHQDLNVEPLSLHFRKALEEIAFASLLANREKYSAAGAGFATEWNAGRMLGFVEKVNLHTPCLNGPDATRHRAIIAISFNPGSGAALSRGFTRPTSKANS